MLKDERLAEILAGVEKVKQDKPYDDPAAAVAALDWLSSAGDDLRKGLKAVKGDVGGIARLQELLNTVDGLSASVRSKIKRDGDDVPLRHSTEPTAPVEL